MNGYQGDWCWMSWILEHCQLEDWNPDCRLSDMENRTTTSDAASAVMCLGRFCAEKGKSVIDVVR